MTTSRLLARHNLRFARQNEAADTADCRVGEIGSCDSCRQIVWVTSVVAAGIGDCRCAQTWPAEN